MPPSSTFVPRRVADPSGNKGVGGVTSREGRWAYPSRASFLSLFISPSSGCYLAPCCREGSAYRWYSLFVPSRTTNSLLVILRRWSFRASPGCSLRARSARDCSPLRIALRSMPRVVRDVCTEAHGLRQPLNPSIRSLWNR